MNLLRSALVLSVTSATLVMAASLVTACDPPGEGAGPAPSTPVPFVSASAPQAAPATPSANAPTDAGAPDGRAATETFPPPKPTTLALGKTGDAALDAKLGEGDVAFAKDDFVAAGRAYAEAARAFPKRAAPIVGIARCEIARETPALDFAVAKGNAKVKRALADLRRAAAMEPDFAPADAELGRAYLLLGEAPDAVEPLRRAARKLPNEAEVASALGVALLASGKGEEAVASLARAVELDPGSAPRHGNLGTVLFMRGRVEEAVKEYRAEVTLDPNDARARSDLGTALLARNDFPGAMRELTKAIELDPKRATFRSNLGYALQLQGKRDEAVASYREAIRLDDKLASAWINLATLLAKDPKTRAEARSALEKARALDPQDPRVVANLEELDALEKAQKKP